MKILIYLILITILSCNSKREPDSVSCPSTTLVLIYSINENRYQEFSTISISSDSTKEIIKDNVLEVIKAIHLLSSEHIKESGGLSRSGEVMSPCLFDPQRSVKLFKDSNIKTVIDLRLKKIEELCSGERNKECGKLIRNITHYNNFYFKDANAYFKSENISKRYLTQTSLDLLLVEYVLFEVLELYYLPAWRIKSKSL
jgi:hypothetical protein